MRKRYKRLTQQQIDNDIIFSSQLIPNGVLHEVHKNDIDASEKIERLLNDSFFNDSPYKYNEIREG